MALFHLVNQYNLPRSYSYKILANQLMINMSWLLVNMHILNISEHVFHNQISLHYIFHMLHVYYIYLHERSLMWQMLVGIPYMDHMGFAKNQCHWLYL